MNLQWKRVMGWVGLLAAAIGLGLLWSFRSIPHNPAPPLLTPWIGLPETGMDASLGPIREALLTAATRTEDGNFNQDPHDSLAWDCSSDVSSGSTETYVALIGSSFIMPDRQALRVKFEVHGSEVEVTIQDAGPLVFPPPPPLPGSKFSNTIETPVPKRLWIEKSSLQPIADIWRRGSFWQAAQKETSCSDGATIIIEACVWGRYAVRDRGCDMSSGIDDLWNALHKVLKLP